MNIRDALPAAKAWGRRWAAAHALWGSLRWHVSQPGRRRLAQAVRYAGRGRTCPYCGWQGRLFYPTAEHPRPDAQCPRCYAKERHRALYFYLERLKACYSHLRVLEVAPEPHSLRYWRHVPEATYVGLDLFSPLASVCGDILALPAPDAAFNVIVCMHVLEHVPDDRAAMRELRRVLARGGRLMVQVPIERDVTFEDPSVTDARERERLFGQGDHVRAYGWDLVGRLEEAGFTVAVEDISRRLSRQQMRQAGVVPGETILICRLSATPFVGSR
jgi:SAM-dependent methyltransferase